MSKEQEQSYHGNGNHDWEVVNIHSEPNMKRLRVPGGWLYGAGPLYTSSTATTFVPMPEVVKHAV